MTNFRSWCKISFLSPFFKNNIYVRSRNQRKWKWRHVKFIDGQNTQRNAYDNQSAAQHHQQRRKNFLIIIFFCSADYNNDSIACGRFSFSHSNVVVVTRPQPMDELNLYQSNVRHCVCGLFPIVAKCTTSSRHDTFPQFNSRLVFIPRND